MKVHNENKVPTIRFKGFEGKWVDRRLGDVCAIGDADHWMPESTSHGIPYVMTGDFCGINEIDFKNAKLISLVDFEKLSKKIKPEFGDLLFARYASIGSVRYINTNREFIASYSCAILKSNSSFNSEYLFFLLQSGNVQNQLKQSINTGSQGNIGIESLKQLATFFPKQKEQTKIGEYFRELDRLIGLHQRKHEKLVTLKKAMLQKMFTQPGTTAPEIRFKGFSGDWVENTLESAAEITTGFPFKSSDFSEYGTYLVITNGNIQNELTFVDATAGNRISIQNSPSLNPFLLRVGDILVTMDGSVGRTAKVSETNQILAQRVGRLVAKSDSEFLYQALNTGAFLEKMTMISHGGTIKHISLSEIGDYKFLLPSDLEEHKKIGIYFRQLDELISKHAIQLQKLKQVKLACLEKMFV